MLVVAVIADDGSAQKNICARDNNTELYSESQSDHINVKVY